MQTTPDVIVEATSTPQATESTEWWARAMVAEFVILRADVERLAELVASR